MKSKLMKRINYIYWTKDAQFLRITNEELAQKIDELEKEGRKRVKASTRSCDYYGYDTYSIEVKGNYFQLKFSTPKGNYVYSTNWFDTTKNERDFKGSDAVRLFEDKFEEMKGTSLLKAYGSVPEEFKRNIPKQLVYTNLTRKVYLSASSVDGCSQYPSGLCGTLPDAHTEVIMDGEVEPSKEYPFAFYSNGHLAIYGELDTRKWLESELAPYLFRLGNEEWAIKENIEYTVLMQPSQYEMNEVWEYFYSKRKENEECKLVMNSTIGCFHTKKYRSRKYAHLVAVTIARGNNKLLELVNKIGIENVIQLCVDGIIYQGNKVLGENYKKLGIFHQEFTDCMIRIDAINRYIVMDSEYKIIKYKCQGMNYYGDSGKRIEEEGVKCFNDMDRWVRIDPIKKLKER